MSSDTPYRVFISYTGQDLEVHAEVVSDMVKRLNADTNRSWVAIDHKFWAPTGRPSVRECMEQVDRCQILIVLVAFRYGWVPTREEGGNGESSITRLEVERARASGLEVIPFLVEDNARWNIADVEGLTDAKALERLAQFKKELRQSLAGFFETPESLEAPTVLALNKAAERIESSRKPRQRIQIEERPDEPDLVVPSYFDPNHPPSLEERLQTHLPKRILSLDSGGVRTAITLGYLERLEELLRIRYSDADFRLSDYFDLIGASGESAIIAAELARGRTVAEAQKTFSDATVAMLSARRFWPMSGARFRSEPVSDVLEASFGDMSLRSEELKTGVAIVLTRVDTAEIWPITNHPQVRSTDRGSLRLREVLLASCAAPMYLSPVELRFAPDSASFMCGLVSVGPAPALYLFLIATGPSFPFRWRIGRRRIFIASIGTGILPAVKREGSLRIFSVINLTVSGMITGLKEQSDLVLAALTHEDVQESSSGKGESNAAQPPRSIVNYKRFNVSLDAANLNRIGLPEMADDLESLISSDNKDAISSHVKVGRNAAERDLDDNLFSPSFDVRPPVR